MNSNLYLSTCSKFACVCANCLDFMLMHFNMPMNRAFIHKPSFYNVTNYKHSPQGILTMETKIRGCQPSTEANCMLLNSTDTL